MPSKFWGRTPQTLHKLIIPIQQNVYIFILHGIRMTINNLMSSSDPVVKTSPSNAGDVGLIPGQGAEIPNAWRPKNQNIKNRNDTATDSIKDF